MNDFKLPDGWTFATLQVDYVVVYSRALQYTVTIDFKRRNFHLGCTTTGKSLSTEKYTGHGWKQKLVDAAVQWLRDEHPFLN